MQVLNPKKRPACGNRLKVVSCSDITLMQMKKCFICFALAVLAAVSCTPGVVLDIKPKEQEEQTQEPQNPDPEEPAYPVDVQDALEEAELRQSLKQIKNYSPHSGVDVSEILYYDQESKPQAVFVMQVDLSDPTISMTNTVPGGATTAFTGGRERLSAQFQRIDAPGNRVIGGVNTQGAAQGLHIDNGHFGNGVDFAVNGSLFIELNMFLVNTRYHMEEITIMFLLHRNLIARLAKTLRLC